MKKRSINKTKKIVWFLGFKSNKHTAVLKYNTDYCESLKTKFDIKTVWFPEKLKKTWFFYFHFIFPLKYFKLLKDKNIIKVFPDESYSFIYLFNVKNSAVVFHHSQKGVKFTNFKETLFFKFIVLTERLVKRADKIITVSNTTKNSLLKFYKEFRKQKIKNKIFTIYNSVNINQLKKVKASKKKLFVRYNLPTTKRKVLLFVGTDETRKNFIILLKAIKDVKGILLIKIGKANNQNNRRMHSKFIKENNLNVVLLDYVPDKDFFSFYKCADIFVTPSLKEGFGRPIIEAQALGLPVICSDLEVFREVGKDSCLYVNSKDASKLAIIISKVLREPLLKKKLITKGYINVKRFDIKNISKIFEKTLGY